MKKLAILFILLSILSCKTVTSTKKPQKFNLSEVWLLTKISYVEPNVFEKIVLFNDATNHCFKDSLWQFNTNNTVGTYAINDLYCSIGKREISYRFLKTEEKTGYSHIVIKTQNKDGKSKDYRIKITQLTNTSMQWHYVVYINNKRHTINMKFEKA